MADSAELPAGTNLGAYRIVRCIATGGMGAVYEAEHRELRKRVAIKTPFTEAGLSPEGRARFVQEGKTASRLRHPHVVDITDVGEVDDVAYLVMEYLEGESLSSRIAREAPLSPDVIADTLLPVAVALHEAHAMGIIHRDLKPDNIYLTRSVQGNIHPKILDFGISKVLGDESPKLTYASNVMLGTPNYLSPEQLESPHSITPRSDQYSLGVVIYEAATGNNPFAGHGSLMSILRAIEKGDYPLPRDVYGQIDERLEQVALRAMAVSPSARYASMAALAAELLPLASPTTQNTWTRYFAPESSGSGALSVPPSGAQASRLFGELRGFWLFAGASLAAMVVGLAAFLASAPGEPTAEAAAPPSETLSSAGQMPVTVASQQTAPAASPRAGVAPLDQRVAPADAIVAAEDAIEPDPPSRDGAVEAAEAPARPPPSRRELARKAELSSAPSAKARYVRAPRSRAGADRPAGAKPSERTPARERPAPARADAAPEPAESANAEAPPRARAAAPSARRTEPLRTDNVDPWDNREH